MLLRVAMFFFGWIELGFVFYAATSIPLNVFAIWSGFGCVALMVSAILLREEK